MTNTRQKIHISLSPTCPQAKPSNDSIYYHKVAHTRTHSLSHTHTLALSRTLTPLPNVFSLSLSLSHTHYYWLTVTSIILLILESEHKAIFASLSLCQAIDIILRILWSLEWAQSYLCQLLIPNSVSLFASFSLSLLLWYTLEQDWA